MTDVDPPGADRPVRLDELPWTEVAEHLRADPRLLLPVGSTLQHGPHLPLSTDTVIASRLADALSARHGVAVAPAWSYGVVSEVEREYAGTASLSRKTLHRSLNDLVGVWEAQGVEEFVLLTAHGHGPHIAAMATVVSERARVRSVDVHSVDLGEQLEGTGRVEHGGELETSLMLHLAPEQVRTERIVDAPGPAGDGAGRPVGEEPVPERGSSGVVGRPSLASAEKGERVFRYLVRLIGDRVLALLLAAVLLAVPVAGVAPAPAQEKTAGEVDSGRFRILRGGEGVATEVFAIRRESSAVRSVARLTTGRDTALLAGSITEARLQTNPAHEPDLFELQVQRGGSLDLVGVRSGDRFRVRTRSPEGERWKEFLVPSGLVVLPSGFVHFHHFLFRQRSEGEGDVTALLPREGVERRVRFRGRSADTVEAAGSRQPATRWEVAVGEQRRLIWRDDRGRILRVEIPSESWVARRLPGEGLGGGPLRDRSSGGPSPGPGVP